MYSLMLTLKNIKKQFIKVFKRKNIIENVVKVIKFGKKEVLQKFQYKRFNLLFFCL